MDVAYDHVQEEALSPSEQHEQRQQSETPNLNTEIQDAYQAVSSSPWAAKLGGWFSSARKQGESLYQDLQKDAQDVQEQATKGFSSLREQVASRTRGLSFNAEPGPDAQVPGEEAVPRDNKTATNAAQDEAEALKTQAEQPESLPADIVKEAGSLVASFRSTAASKLRDLAKAEDAADEALLKFGTNVRNFLRDAVIVSAPTDADASKPRGTDAAGNEVLFETLEPGTGKKVFHSTRLDAQLHAIHTTAYSFLGDPHGKEWQQWSDDFDVEAQTGAIAKDLDKYEELRRAMEKLVPEKVDYRTFWARYYFLRKAIEEEERRRREVLKGAASQPSAQEEVAWDDDDEDEQQNSTPLRPHNESTTTLNAPSAAHHAQAGAADNGLLKLKSPRRSHEEENKSVAGSDASYDIVSGATSRAAGSPKEERREKEVKKEESDDDWE